MNNALPTLSLVAPCFNEQDAIPAVVADIQKLIHSSEFKERFSSLEVIIVDDGSTDTSLLCLKNHPWVITLEHKKNLGYGAALKTGLGQSNGDFIFFFDIDGSYDVNDVLAMYDQLIKADSDLVLGNRIHHRQGMPILRRIGNIFFTQLIRLAIGGSIGDVVTGARIFRRSLLQEMLIEDDDWNYTLVQSIYLAKAGKKISETPIDYRPRLGTSKLNAFFQGLAFLKVIARSL